MLPYVIALLQIPYAIFAASNGTEEDDHRVHCPRPESATSSCDAPTFFTYYTCCGEENMFCCMRLQLHITIGGAVILVAILVALAAFLVNWVCRITQVILTRIPPYQISMSMGISTIANKPTTNSKTRTKRPPELRLLVNEEEGERQFQERAVYK